MIDDNCAAVVSRMLETIERADWRRHVQGKLRREGFIAAQEIAAETLRAELRAYRNRLRDQLKGKQ